MSCLITDGGQVESLWETGQRTWHKLTENHLCDQQLLSIVNYVSSLCVYTAYWQPLFEKHSFRFDEEVLLQIPQSQEGKEWYSYIDKDITEEMIQCKYSLYAQ